MEGRIAKCCCGQLSVKVQGEPESTAICNCSQCQSRTGSAFSVHTFFPHTASQVSGRNKVFTRTADSGRKVSFHFCPDCGSTVYWQTEVRPTSYGIAVGAFREPSFPAPTRAIWTEKKLHWVQLPDGMPTLPRGLQQTNPAAHSGSQQ